MRPSAPVLVGILLPLLCGCAALDLATGRTEERQLAWIGPGLGPCLFGGVTARAETHCARLAFAEEGVLRSVNERVRASLGNARCTAHVEAVQAALSDHAGILSEPVYSCPQASRASGECHVSLLATTRSGERYVIDNGSVVNDAVGADGVASLDAFAEQVAGVYWIGTPPNLYEVSVALPGFMPARAASAR